MNINDLKDKLPIKIKLNKNFTLAESFDNNTILLLKVANVENEDDFGKSWKILVTALKEDLEHNKTVAIYDWYNPENNKYDLSYYDTHRPNSVGNYEDTIYVMEDDDCFDLIDSTSPSKETIEYALNVLEELKLRHDLMSDFSSRTHGYKFLCDKIDELKKMK